MPDHGLRFAGSGRRVSQPRSQRAHNTHQASGAWLRQSLEPASHAFAGAGSKPSGDWSRDQVACSSAEYSGFWREGYVSSVKHQSGRSPPSIADLDHGPWVWLASLSIG